MSAFAEYAGAVPGLMLAGCRGAGLLFVAPGVSSPLVPGVVRVLLGVMLGVVALSSSSYSTSITEVFMSSF